MKFLGQVVDQTEIRPDPEKIKAIKSVQAPKNGGDLRRFLGMVNHLSKFSPNLAEKTKPLGELLNKQSDWVWGDPQRQAFQDIKKSSHFYMCIISCISSTCAINWLAAGYFTKAVVLPQLKLPQKRNMEQGVLFRF